MYEIPVGTFNQVELPLIDMSARRIGLFFAGSVAHGRLPGSPKPRVWEQVRDRMGPKTASRRSMLRAMKDLAAANPEVSMEVSEAEGYIKAIYADPEFYSRKLMDAKLSLVPRGTSPQTFRFFQSMRAGCAVITDVLPSQWFFEGSPAIRVRSWKELHDVVPGLLDEDQLLRRHHQASLHWWKTRCSEEALAAYMADRLNHLPDT